MVFDSVSRLWSTADDSVCVYDVKVCRGTSCCSCVLIVRIDVEAEVEAVETVQAAQSGSIVLELCRPARSRTGVGGLVA